MPNKQQSFEFEPNKPESVKCFGMAFENDEARRAYFLERLKEKLQDPEFRRIPGFPKGTDDEILRMSDPPYYTSCPNPFLTDFVQIHGRSYDPNEEYLREPFAVDVSEGKNDPVYNAHSYHTKVPHQVIVQYLEHYTQPGDLILDCFCGSGMTGVAAAEANGGRPVILCDLSPAATLIAYNYSAPKDPCASRRYIEKMLEDVEADLKWMYRTAHTGWPSSDRRVRTSPTDNPGPDRGPGEIQFVLWSDLFSCPNCGERIVYWHETADYEAATLRDKIICSSCKAQIPTGDLERIWESQLDSETGQVIKQPERVPILIQYEYNGKTYHKVPDGDDLELIARTNRNHIGNWYPDNPLHDGDKTTDPKSVGITHAHHFYTRRNLSVLARIWHEANAAPSEHRAAMRFLFTSTHAWATRMNRLLVSNFFKKRGGVIGQTLSGTLYVSSVQVETNPLYRFRLRADSAASTVSSDTLAVTTQSATKLQQIPSQSVDYVFIDPPFGHNLVYSDLNFLWESWLGVWTDATNETIVSSKQGKSLTEYQSLMEETFRELHRVLKPGRWVTVEFHNSQNAVWRAIQNALGRAGLVVANVSLLEKTHGTFNQVTAAGAVRKDLAISAYKPDADLEQAFSLHEGSVTAMWKFVAAHLAKVPLWVGEGEDLSVIAERQEHTLYDRMVMFHVQRNLAIPVSAAEFYYGLQQRFAEREGMYYLPEQAHAYDRHRASVKTVKQLTFDITDEASAIFWARAQLDKRPQSFQDLNPTFMRESQTWAGHEKPVELKEILEENFLLYDGTGPVPAQIHTYLSTNFKDMRGLPKESPALKAKAADRWYVPDPNKQADLDQLRTKRLLKEFAEYKESKQKKLKQFRTEAIRAGFKAAYDQRDYLSIVEVSRKLPEQVIQEDEKLLMYYDVASMRLGED